jgi:peptidoglycan/xylan/chitin deacetylase (PgdA/CDA1 family)
VTPAARTLLKVAASALDGLRRPAPGLVVLIYHRVGRRTPIEVDLPLMLFEEQIRFLTEQCHVVTLDEGLRLIASPDDASGTVVAVTFDDGTADFVELALPVLERHSVPVTLYLATSFIEKGEHFPDDGVPLSWAGLRDALSTGVVEVGSHTHHHALLDRLPVAEIDKELDRSIELIGERLDVKAAHFAYPKAIPGSPAADAAVRRRFRSAALAGTHPNRFAATDAYRLARSPLQVSDGMHWFTRKALGGLELEDTLRRLVNRRRYGGVTT